MDGPALWFLNRGTGIVLLVLMTLTVVLGILSTTGRGRRVPSFVTQHLHRNVSLLSLALLAVHVVAALIDTYVDIRWWQAIVPFAGTYRPFSLGMGALALDLMGAITVTSLLRDRMPEPAWRWLHLTSYLAWGVAVVHGIGIGTDAMAPWSWWITVGCVACVAVVWVVRVFGRTRGESA